MTSCGGRPPCVGGSMCDAATRATRSPRRSKRGSTLRCGAIAIGDLGLDDTGRLEASRIPTVRIGNVDVHNVAFADAVELIWRCVEESRGLVVCTPNADHVVRARADAELRDAMAAADLRVPDGMGIVYASRIAGRPIRGTVTGRLLVPALAARAASAGVPLTLFGAQRGVAE